MFTLFSAVFRLSGCRSTAINASSQKQWVLLLFSLLERFKEKTVERCKRSSGRGRKSPPLPSQKRSLSLLFPRKTNERGKVWKDQENGKGRETSFPHKSLSVFFFNNFKQRSQPNSFQFSLPQTKRTTLLSSTLGEGCIDTSLFTFSKSSTKSSCAKIQVFETLPPSWSKFSFFNFLPTQTYHNLPQKQKGTFRSCTREKWPKLTSVFVTLPKLVLHFNCGFKNGWPK